MDRETNFYWKLTEKVENKDSEAPVDEDNNKFAEEMEKVDKNVDSTGEGKEHMPVPKRARLDEEESDGSCVNLDEIEKSVDDTNYKPLNSNVEDEVIELPPSEKESRFFQEKLTPINFEDV